MIKRLTVAVAALFVLATPALCAGLYPLSNQQRFDANGKPLVGAKLYLYDGGTTTPRVGYKDSSLTAPHPNPIVADGTGALPLIYLADGFYRQRLTTKTGTQIFDQDGIPVLSTTAGGSGTSVDPDSVFKSRDLKIRFDDQPLSGYVRLNGRTIGSASSGATERANIDTQPLYEELWAYGNIVVVGGKGASAAADFAANKPLALPNAAGRGLFGMDDLGAGAQNVLTSATIANPTVIGSTGGIQSLVITQANLPSYNLVGGTGNATTSGTTTTESVAHTHFGSGQTGGMTRNATHSHTYDSVLAAGGSGLTSGPFSFGGAGTSSTANIDHEHNYSFTTGAESTPHTHNFSGSGVATNISINSGGSGALFQTLPPVILLMIYIRL